MLADVDAIALSVAEDECQSALRNSNVGIIVKVKMGMRKMSRLTIVAAATILCVLSAHSVPKALGENRDELKARLLKQFDANGNGKLEPGEVKAAKQALAKERAAQAQKDNGQAQNGNGQGQNGKQANDGKQTDNRRGKNQGGQSGGGEFGIDPRLVERFDTNGNGRLDPSEKQAAKLALSGQLKRFDRNGNGRLEPSEQKAAQAALSKQRGG